MNEPKRLQLTTSEVQKDKGCVQKRKTPTVNKPEKGTDPNPDSTTAVD